MAYTPAYKETWIATAFKVSKKKGMLTPVDRYIDGPIFPSFILADLSTYEGFIDFVEWVGIAGFIYLDEPNWINTISNNLERVRIGELKTISDSYIQKFYERIRTNLLTEQEIMTIFYGLYFYSSNRKSPFDRYPHDTFDMLYRNVSRHLALVKVIAQQPAIFNSNDFRKNKITWSFSYESLPARCYMEMIDMIDNKEKVKECAYCGEIFIPSRKNEIFCNRLAPGHRRPGEERTCKQLGPLNKFEEVNTGYRKLYKRYQNRLAYLKKRGENKEYKRTFAEFQSWKKKNHPA